MEKPKYLTFEFWLGLLSAIAMLVVSLGIVSQEEANTWVELLAGLVAAVLPIIALITGYGQVRAARVEAGLLDAETPGYMTAEFWLTLAATVTMVLVSLRVINQEQADMWLQLLGPFVAGVLAIVAYIRSRVVVQVSAVRLLALKK